ncbi:hypothetical protein, partial [Streptomyces exfoliatus]|uniref:hypothetical protein n=1 Tax=Streptomyces exfoliatus TaxID=1905 RepID=UPI001B807402
MDVSVLVYDGVLNDGAVAGFRVQVAQAPGVGIAQVDASGRGGLGCVGLVLSAPFQLGGVCQG